MNKKMVAIALIPIAIGFLLIIISVLELQNTTNQVANAYWIHFYKSIVPIISICLVAGAFLVVIGGVYLKNIRNKWSYSSITVGFSLIAVEAAELAITLKGTQGPSGIGWGDFQQHWALSFFSVLMAACFLIVLGIILGLKTKNKLGYVMVTGGFAVMLVGASVLAANLATSLDYYPPNYYFSLQAAWNTTISYFLIIGAIIVATGTGYLMWARNRNRRNATKQ
ncbi:MAG: hypothetical protein ABSF44_01985 [Candidatus Bathyarchaeia archaeon]|jgi:hypothetical protein